MGILTDKTIFTGTPENNDLIHMVRVSDPTDNPAGTSFAVEISKLRDSYWTSGSTGSFSIKAKNDSGVDATNEYSHAEGYSTLASGGVSHAEGFQTIASGEPSHAEGYSTIASGNSGSHAEGRSTVASGQASHAEGRDTTASGFASHAEGIGNVASGEGSHAEGGVHNNGGEFIQYQPTSATTYSSHAEGAGTLASGEVSHAEGRDTTASGLNSHSEGFGTIASGSYAHAEGEGTIAVGTTSHAEGAGTLASGTQSHAEGKDTVASGNYSHAGGINSIASGDTSFIHSTNSLVTGARSVVLGGQNITGTTDDTVYVPKLNISDVGTGTSINILGVDVNGNVVSNGELYSEIEIELTEANIERIWDGYELIQGIPNKLIALDRCIISSNINQAALTSGGVFGGSEPTMQILLGETTDNGHIKSLTYLSPSGLTNGALTPFEYGYFDENEDWVLLAEYIFIDEVNLTISSTSGDSIGGLYISLEDGEIVDYFLISRSVGYEIGDTITINNGTLSGQSSDIIFTVSELTDTISPSHTPDKNRQQVFPFYPSTLISNINSPSIGNLVFRNGSNGLIGYGTGSISLQLPSDYGKVGKPLLLNIGYIEMENDLANPIVTWRYYNSVEGTLTLKLWYRILE